MTDDEKMAVHTRELDASTLAEARIAALDDIAENVARVTAELRARLDNAEERLRSLQRDVAAGGDK